MYNPKQASEILKMPASTLRRYASDYAHLLSETARRAGAKRRYTPDDLRLIARIKEYTVQRKTSAEIESLLQIPPEEKPPEVPQDDLRLAPYLAEQFERLFEQFRRGQQDQAAKIDQLSEEIKQLREELDESRRPFWQKIRRKKPPE